MSPFIDSLRRLYSDNKISKKRLDELFSSKKINQEEYYYILTDEKKAV